MSRQQVVAVSIAGLLIILIYLFGRFKPEIAELNRKQQSQESAESAPKEGDFNTSVYLEEIGMRHPSISGDSLKLLSESFTNSASADKKLINYLIDNNDLLAAGIYATKNAEKTNSDSLWVKAGDLFMRAIRFSDLNAEALNFASESASNSYEQAVSINPGNPRNQVRLAETYMENQATVMNGVTLLLDVVKQDSMNADANFILGKFGVISGQYEKAINRLEKVVSLQTQNAEAYFLLADAYMGLGDKKSAIACFEKCQKAISDDALKQEIDRIIQQLKNTPE